MHIKKLYTLSSILFFGLGVAAQAPGGVAANLKLWIKSDAGVTATAGAVDSWTYSNDLTKSFIATLADRPAVALNSVNFFPSINFNGANQMLGPNGLNAPIVAGDDDYAVFGVWRATSPGAQRIWSQRSTVSAFNNGVSLSHYNDGSTNFWGNQAEIAPFTQTWTKSFQLGSWKISQLNLLAQDNDDQQVFDETNTNDPVISNTYNFGSGQAVRNLADESNSLGARNTPTEEAFVGEMTEIIVYDAAVVTPLTRQQIFSYLALKYGISKTGDYFASNGTTKFWDSTANTAFRFSVFGLGQDDNSGLLMASSNSVETGTGNGTGQSGLGNIVLSAPSALSNLEFLMIGNNNAALSEQATDVPVTADPAVRRFAREWKVQHTGTVGTVTLTFDFNGLATTGTIGNVTHFRLMVDEDGDGDFTTGTIRYQQPSSFSGSVASFTNLI
ncbi:MAG: hypothetical protein H7Y27_02900, partial [Gemmatimonadaceae bacterium]|nr:hypothetical protein [Chitinophagaceae bacterium]